MATTVRGTIAGMAQRANPAFAVAVVAIPLAALGYRERRREPTTLVVG